MKGFIKYALIILSLLVISVGSAYLILGEDARSLCANKCLPETRSGNQEKAEVAAPEVVIAQSKPMVITKPARGKAWIAYGGTRTRMYPYPNTSKVLGKYRLKSPWTGSKSANLIMDAKLVNGEGWYSVLLPQRPNGRVAWVKANSVSAELTNRYVRVNLKERQVEYWNHGKKLHTWPAVIGTVRTPTPRGIHAVQDIMSTDPKLFTGSRMVVLTAHSNAMEKFEGEDARTALHGRGPQSLKDPLGQALSNGCVRMNNRDIEELSRLVKIGDPVWIS